MELPLWYKIITYQKSGHSVLEIQDNGVGIDDNILDKITQPFFTTKGLGKGTGLGLAVSYGIIENNNGNIDIQSEVNRGTSVIITFPIEAT